MTGRDLYELYQQACFEVSNCGTDSWEELDDSSKAEWDRLAFLIEGKV